MRTGAVRSGGKRAARRIAAAAAALAVAAAAAVLWLRSRGAGGPPDLSPPREGELWVVTAYCNCEKCCDWERAPDGTPVHSKGPMKGKPKVVGKTASGKTARRGTVAADTRILPFGTRLFVEGYGECRVEDRGGAIKGRHIDLWFPSHEEAKAWGRREMPVKFLELKGAKR